MSAVSSTWTALAAGVGAGYGIAVPLGAIGVLIVHEGLTHGWRTASAAASGTAVVDLGYAGLALAAGAAVTTRLQGYTRALQLAGAVVLVLVVARGLITLRRESPPDPAERVPSERVPSGRGPLRTLRAFVALTAVNPLTAVYFVVLTTGLGTIVHGTAAAVAFATGVFLASWSWQLLLAGAGSLAGDRLPPGARTVTALAGYLIVLGYAVRLARG